VYIVTPKAESKKPLRMADLGVPPFIENLHLVIKNGHWPLKFLANSRDEVLKRAEIKRMW
jgi:hypothetical protein